MKNNDRLDIQSYLYSLKGLGSKLGLKRMKTLANALGNPEKSFKCILVGGTNGKGSTVAMLSSVLKQAGFKVGRFTSPHLISLNERISVNDLDISDADLSAIILRIKKTIETIKKDPDFEHPTFFEVLTAAAFCYFQEKNIDFAVLEVGLGGRLDATNIVDPIFSIITNISLEHTHILGDTKLKIAKEKAGIIRSNNSLITTIQDNELLKFFEDICKDKNTKLFSVSKNITIKSDSIDLGKQTFQATVQDNVYSNISLPLLGDHQLQNAGCVLGACYLLNNKGFPISSKAIKKGLSNVHWPGRFEIVEQHPIIILDCAKDIEAISSLKKTVETIAGVIKYNKLIIILGISSDKNLTGMIQTIVPLANKVIITKHDVQDRAADPRLIADIVEKYNVDYEIIENIPSAIKLAKNIAKKQDLILITGSVFTVGAAKEFWNKTNSKLGRNMNEFPKK